MPERAPELRPVRMSFMVTRTMRNAIDLAAPAGNVSWFIRDAIQSHLDRHSQPPKRHKRPKGDL